MKKTLLTLLTLFVILTMLSVPVLAGPPTAASGVWKYTPYIESVRVADGNTFLDTVEDGVWTGTFEGTSTEVGMVVLHCSGKASFNGTLSFVGEVDGRSGTLEISQVGQCCDEQGHWKGQWVILCGTEGLATLRGQGTWFGPGAGGFGVWGDIEYAGNYHFEPE